MNPVKYNPGCLRKVANWSKMKATHKFDKSKFDPETVKTDIEKYSPKMAELLKNIKDLDDKDLAETGTTYKHFIFSDVKQGGFGAKVIASSLIASGMTLGYTNKIKVKSELDLLDNKGKNFFLLCSTAVFDLPITSVAKKEILSTYNKRPDNIYGDLARIIVMDSGFKEGIDLFDVKYVHIFEPQTSKADQKQVIGRGTRTCGQKGLDFHPTKGWPLHVFVYDVGIPKEMGAETLFKLYVINNGIDLRKLQLADELEKYSIIGSVDYELNKNIHRFEIEDDSIANIDLFAAEGGAKTRAKPTEVHCDKNCGKGRPTRDVPISKAMFITAFLAQKRTFPEDIKTLHLREFFCQLLKSDRTFCAKIKEIFTDRISFVKMHAKEIMKAIKLKKHYPLLPSAKASFLKFIFGILPRPDKKVLGEFMDKETQKLINAAPKPKVDTPDSSPSPEKKVEEEKTDKKKVGKKKTPTDKKKKVVEKEDDVELEPTVPSKHMSFLGMRQHVRENFSQFAWPKVQLENMCGPAPPRKSTSNSQNAVVPNTVKNVISNNSERFTNVVSQTPLNVGANTEGFINVGPQTPINSVNTLKNVGPQTVNTFIQQANNAVVSSPQTNSVDPFNAPLRLPQNTVSNSDDDFGPLRLPEGPKANASMFNAITTTLKKGVNTVKTAIRGSPYKVGNSDEIASPSDIKLEEDGDEFKDVSPSDITLEVNSKKGGAEIMNFTPTQDFLRNFYTPATDSKGMLFWHSVGTGKCHAKDTPIIMYDGKVKLVQDIKKGDVLMGDDSTPRKVLSLANGEDEMYDIVPVKGDKYTVNSEHILVLKYSGKGTITNIKKQTNLPYKTSHFNNKTNSMISKSFATKIEAEEYLKKFTEKDKIVEIEVRDYLKLAKTLQKELKGFRKGAKFQSKNIGFDPYMIGFWLGDGTSRDSKITTQDSRVIAYFKNELPNYNLVLNYESKYDYRISTISRKHPNVFLKELQKNNLIENKHIPDIYKCNDSGVRLLVLAGLLDSDGSYSNKDKCFYISQKSDRLAEDILYLARSLGYAAYNKKCTKTWTYKGVKKSGLYNCMTISGNGLEKIPTKIERKKAQERTQIKDALVTGITVKNIGKGKYYGFTLDGNNRYLLGDFTVTHNTCSAIATASSSFEKEGYTILWVTRTTLKSDIWKNMFDQVCSMDIKAKIEKGVDIPPKLNDRMRLLSSNWSIRPMSYKQFSNLVAGNNSLYKSLVKKNGSKDPLRKTLLIIDEAHKLYGGTDLSSIERPDMNKLHAAIMKSYKVSGKNSVRLMLMTATPFTNDPMELVKLLNLCRPEDEQMPVDYTPFARKYLTPFGTFSKKGKRRFLDDIAGQISYLNRERDARQFAQPRISSVIVPMSTSDGVDVQSVKNDIKDAVQLVKANMNDLKESIKTEKKSLTQRKKEIKAQCKGLKKQELAECKDRVLQELEQVDDDFIDFKASKEKEMVSTKQDITKIRKEMKSKLEEAKNDASQLNTIQKSCVSSSKTKKPKSEKKTKAKAKPTPDDNNSDDESVA